MMDSRNERLEGKKWEVERRKQKYNWSLGYKMPGKKRRSPEIREAR